MSAGTGGALDALGRHARADPEQPFLFFRSSRGTITWWSFARSLREAADSSSRVRASPDEAAFAAPWAFLDLLASADADDLARSASILTALAGRAAREIWISARPLERPEERALALAAALGGWAVLREPGEPGESPAPAIFLWTRPTIVSGEGPELSALWRGVGAEAPRWRRERWLARRLERLGIVFVERDGSLDEARRALAELGEFPPGPRFLPFPGSGW